MKCPVTLPRELWPSYLDLMTRLIELGSMPKVYLKIERCSYEGNERTIITQRDTPDLETEDETGL